MENVIIGQAAGTAPAQLSTHRRAIMDMLVGHPLILTAEYDTAMQATLACQSLATLQKWYRNTVREIARREEQGPATEATTPVMGELLDVLNNPARVSEADLAEAHELMGYWYAGAYQVWLDNHQPVEYATAEQKEEVARLCNSVYITRAEKVKVILALPRYTYTDAVACIGDLWATILQRQEQFAEGRESAGQSFSEAC